jgi:hypothetical protein
MNEWEIADRVSDGIVDLVNAELEDMKQSTGHMKPLQILAGQLLALMATFNTMPEEDHPMSLDKLQFAVAECLKSMMNVKQ